MRRPSSTEAPERLAPSLTPAPATRPRAVTFRAILLGLALLPVNAYWVVMMESVRSSAHPTTISLFFNCLFILVVLTVLNSLIARAWPRRAFSQGELVLVYSMLVVGSCLAGTDMGLNLVTGLIYPFGQANTVNGYQPLFWRFLPRWAMMDNAAANQGFYLGHDTLYTRVHLLSWLRPALVWTGFVTMLLFVMQCVNVLIRKQWADYERLGYPITRIPLEITDAQPGGRGRAGTSLARNRLFWLGFALAALMDGVNSLNYYYPSIPSILAPGNGQSLYDLKPFLTDKPWSAVDWLPLGLYPFVIGLGMLMPKDFLFSSWFFYLTWKLQMVWASAAAWDADPKMPYANYQAFGAYLLFFAGTAWLSRRYFGQVLRCALGRPSELSDVDEALSYRSALLGLALGLTILVGFAVALGLSWWLAVVFFLIYLALALAITRMRVELGTPVHDLHWTGPDWMLTDLLGPRTLGPQSLAVFSLFFWFNRAYRGHPMPAQAEAFRMAEQTGAMGLAAREMRGWFWALLLAGAVGTLCAFWAILHCGYHYGYAAQIRWRPGPEAWDRYAGWLRQPRGPNGRVGVAIIAGFLFAAFLQAMRVRFPWWPFHPLAYAVSGSWAMNVVWVPLLIAWAVKSLLLRFGGLRTYQASLPFFYGLILGQFIPGSLLNLWGILTGSPTYQFWQ